MNGHYSQWINIKFGVPQGSILDPLLFLIYINDLSEYLASNTRLFTNDASLIYVVKGCDLSAFNLNDLIKISNFILQ